MPGLMCSSGFLYSEKRVVLPWHVSTLSSLPSEESVDGAVTSQWHRLKKMGAPCRNRLREKYACSFRVRNRLRNMFLRTTMSLVQSIQKCWKHMVRARKRSVWNLWFKSWLLGCADLRSERLEVSFFSLFSSRVLSPAIDTGVKNITFSSQGSQDKAFFCERPISSSLELPLHAHTPG